MKLRVVHVAADMSTVAGGVPAVVRDLTEGLAQHRVAVQVVHATGDANGLAPGVEAFRCQAAAVGAAWSWGMRLRRCLAELANVTPTGIPIFHLHGVWLAPQYVGARAAHRASIPFLVTAHGMLEPWLWDQQGWRIQAKKRAYWRVAAYPALSKAAIVHAITPLERDHLSKLFPTNRIEIIPNAVHLDEASMPARGERTRTILFLGRLEPKKGVDLLLHAFASAKIDDDWFLEVVGPPWSDVYMRTLENIVQESELAGRVRFRGPVFGAEKHALINSAWVLVAPSHSEVVGLVNLEAAGRCLPTITTYETGLHDWESGGGMLIRPDIDSITHALETACSWSAEEQADRGLASRQLVRQRYSWEAVLPRWVELYSSIASQP